MNKVKLIQNIEKSNLSVKDKTELIKILNGTKTNYSGFLLAFARILEVGSAFEKLFDIDIGEVLENF